MGARRGVVANAQTYPIKPVRVIVPFAPGGATDILARLIGQKLTESWGQQVVVENRPGGGTVIGTDLVAKWTADGGAGSARLARGCDPGAGYSVPDMNRGHYACLHGCIPLKGAPAHRSGTPPDGYTLLMVSTSTVTAPTLLPKLPYDTLRDLAPVIQLVSSPNVLAVLSGEAAWQFSAILSTVPYLKAGRLRALAVSSANRSSVLPEVPPVADTLPGFEASPWTGASAPGGTPRELIARLNQEIARGLNAPDARARLARDGNEVVAGPPEQFDAFFRAQIEKWGKVIRDAGIRL